MANGDLIDDHQPAFPDGGEDEEDHGPFEAWLRRGISDRGTAIFARFVGDKVPDRDPVAGSPWLPRGPINVGGRVRAIALDPELVGGAPRGVYVGAASGGVFRSLDNGATWHSIWDAGRPAHTIGVLAMGGDAAHRTLWVGTGEKDRMQGDGVWRLTLPAGADGPIAWDHVGTLALMSGVADQAQWPFFLECAAVDPDNQDICWFGGPLGLYRYKAGAWMHWPIPSPAGAGRSGPGVADVKFAKTHVGRYLLVAPLDTAWGDIIAIADPEAGGPPDPVGPALAAAVLNPLVAPPAGLALPVLVGPPPFNAVPALRCANARIAVIDGGAGNPDRVYAVYANAAAAGAQFFTVRRATCAAGPAWPTAINWPTLLPVGAPVFPATLTEAQGDYNLFLVAQSLGAAAANDLIVWGMTDIYASANGGANWRVVLDWHEYDNGNVGQHADQHGAAFAAGPGTLWVVNDGGVTRTSTLLGPGDPSGVRTPTSAGWRRSVSGLVCAQTYDLSASPALPDVSGIALQDIGGWVDGGGGMWRYIQGGDGLGTAFDPNDPHLLITTWQGDDNAVTGVDRVLFEADMHFTRPWRTLGPRGPRGQQWEHAMFRGLTPRRGLSLGIVPDDRAEFEDTIAHPTISGRLLNIRRRRLYLSDDGEAFRPVRLGDRFELFVRLTLPFTLPGLSGVTVRVGGDAALRLGFLPSETSDLHQDAGGPTVFRVRIPSAAGTYDEAVAGSLDITIEVFGLDPATPGGAAYTAGQTALLAANQQLQVATTPAQTAAANGAIAAANAAITAAALVLAGERRATYQRTFSLAFPANANALSYQDLLLRLATAFPGPTAGAWSPVGGAAAAPLPAGTIVELYALPCFAPRYWLPGGSVEIVSRNFGADVYLDIDPTGALSSTLALAPRHYAGAAGRPAVATLRHVLAADPGGPFAAGSSVKVQEMRTHAPNPLPLGTAFTGAIQDAHDLEPHLVAARFAPLRVATNPRMWPIVVTKYVRLHFGRLRAAQPAARVNIDGASTALAGLTAGAPITGANLVAQAVFDLRPVKRGRYDLSAGAPTPRLRLVIGGVNHDIDFHAADFGAQLADITAEEVARTIDAALNGGANPTDITVEVQRDIDVGAVFEVAYAHASPNVQWVGGINQVWLSTDDGVTWNERYPAPPAGRHWDTYFTAEAIAPDPFPPADPANPVYTALVGSSLPYTSLARFVSNADAVPLDGIAVPAGYDNADPDARLRIYALEADPRRRDTYYAGTELGVYRSTNGGSTWEAFSVGLPHLPTLDLAIDDATDTLRVAVFGRGVFERYLGDTPPALPTVWLRANTRDAARRPVVHGDALVGDSPVRVDAAHSPDITVTTLPTPAPPYDANELEDLESEPARRTTAHTIAVRARNRGALAVADARVLLAWAPAPARALPPLTAAFWAAYGGAAAIAAGTRFDAWTVIGDQRDLAIDAGSAVAATFAWNTNNAPHLLAAINRVALVVIAKQGQPAIDGNPADVARLAVRDARVALRIVDVREPDGGAVVLTGVGADTAVGLTPTPPPVVVASIVPTPEFAPPSAGPPVGPAPLGFQSAGPAPLPGPAAISSLAPPWNTVATPTLTIDYRERATAARPVYPVGAAPAVIAAARGAADTIDYLGNSFVLAFTDGTFAAPNAVTPPEMRTFLRGQIARQTRLVRVEAPDVALAIRGGRAGEIAVTAQGVAATNDSFGALALAATGTVAVGPTQRFSVRVWNDGVRPVPNADIRFYLLDPAVAAPAAVAFGAPPVAHANLPPGTSAIAFTEGVVAGDDIVIAAQLHDPLDPEPVPPAFASWEAVLDWIDRTPRSALRMFRRRP